MGFFYHESAGQASLKLDGTKFEHIFKVRRTKEDESLNFANLNDGKIYEYRTKYIEKKSASLELITAQDGKPCIKDITIAWCVVDPKTIEKTIPSLNELGVAKIEFIYSKRSQRNFAIKPERLDSIIIASCEQCGRTQKIEFEFFSSLDNWLKKQKEFFVLDFGGDVLPKELSNGTYMIGPEGGFGNDERNIFKSVAKKIYSFDSDLILKSETAVVSVASRFI